MAERGLVAVYVSVTSLDPTLARILEPRAAAPHRRLKTIEALARAGVPVGVSVSPIIPFINEPEIERILEAAASRRRDVGLRHRAALAMGSESDVPALARSALSGSCRLASWRACARCAAGRTTTRDSAPGCSGEGVWAELLAQRFKQGARAIRPRPGARRAGSDASSGSRSRRVATDRPTCSPEDD